MSEKGQNFTEKKSTRRNFLKNSGLTIGGVVLGGAVGSLLGKDNATVTEETGHQQHAAETSSSNTNAALMFFSPEQFQITEAAVERIFPADDNGPGAKELLVAYFIDHQLASGWGTGAKEYTSGPFFPGEGTQGYQSSLNRQDVFTIGLAALESQSKATYEKSFIELSEEEQDAVLTEFDDGKVKMKGVSSDFFFSLLRSTTIEGVYADPLYGGNANMAGWKMKNFPGHQMSFMSMIEKDEVIKLDPIPLSSQHGH
ncbi:gluconate 2-dehydrogenase subunit 3 family protein [Ureibacillus aquaedulcis]|uniref:Gluconate 2-dehydrogenase subunit 3 family protein n=1 Tax=Ureibacillus aquaedulcis TaxID=3058421 RepID=A0ABT8GPR4_9BACL|nr:gluconate 2-dehydrogenase subunit 3 family protein [Ureibacillus sp. BA0131]MDN4493407.1 gluconate 2-dehydrogenase subunit 3 family protein [Ureibacillus sp. BA0131]